MSNQYWQSLPPEGARIMMSLGGAFPGSPWVGNLRVTEALPGSEWIKVEDGKGCITLQYRPYWRYWDNRLSQVTDEQRRLEAAKAWLYVDEEGYHVWEQGADQVYRVVGNDPMGPQRSGSCGGPNRPNWVELRFLRDAVVTGVNYGRLLPPPEWPAPKARIMIAAEDTNSGQKYWSGNLTVQSSDVSEGQLRLITKGPAGEIQHWPMAGLRWAPWDPAITQDGEDARECSRTADEAVAGETWLEVVGSGYRVWRRLAEPGVAWRIVCCHNAERPYMVGDRSSWQRLLCNPQMRVPGRRVFQNTLNATLASVEKELNALLRAEQQEIKEGKLTIGMDLGSGDATAVLDVTAQADSTDPSKIDCTFTILPGPMVVPVEAPRPTRQDVCVRCGIRIQRAGQAPIVIEGVPWCPVCGEREQRRLEEVELRSRLLRRDRDTRILTDHAWRMPAGDPRADALEAAADTYAESRYGWAIGLRDRG